MKVPIVNNETGEVYDTIASVYNAYCAHHNCSDCLLCSLMDDDEDRYRSCQEVFERNLETVLPQLDCSFAGPIECGDPASHPNDPEPPITDRRQALATMLGVRPNQIFNLVDDQDDYICDHDQRLNYRITWTGMPLCQNDDGDWDPMDSFDLALVFNGEWHVEPTQKYDHDWAPQDYEVATIFTKVFSPSYRVRNVGPDAIDSDVWLCAENDNPLLKLQQGYFVDLALDESVALNEIIDLEDDINARS